MYWLILILNRQAHGVNKLIIVLCINLTLGTYYHYLISNDYL